MTRCSWWRGGTSLRLEQSCRKPPCVRGHPVSVSVGVVRAKVQGLPASVLGWRAGTDRSHGAQPWERLSAIQRGQRRWERGCLRAAWWSGLASSGRLQSECCLSKHTAPLEMLTQAASGTPLPLPETPPGSPGVGLVQVVGSHVTPTLLSSACPPPAGLKEAYSQGDRLTSALLPHHPHQVAPA